MLNKINISENKIVEFVIFRDENEKGIKVNGPNGINTHLGAVVLQKDQLRLFEKERHHMEKNRKTIFGIRKLYSSSKGYYIKNEDGRVFLTKKQEKKMKRALYEYYRNRNYGIFKAMKLVKDLG